MTEKEAYNKAFKIADLLGISTIKYNKDGSKTVRNPKPVKNNEINITDIINVIME